MRARPSRPSGESNNAHQPLTCAHSDGPIRTGETESILEAREALQRVAERLVSFTNGRFLPSPPPAALDELTDKLIMVAAR